ncbi:hypothetical protein DS831_00650 [Bombilactobacillus bombi]|uniref:SGNH hydrolase-type esterase domain-containing protein n=1 Tax=Bombilactobacillus bombi TaxID=1303590 RepID=A0A417ZJ14_9LACO|nr:SGNH/GDSL hydrolase family protein [Bombilactobacillus bombi]RHW51876.1 hypothetical protein DS831_00650 [Bombilactobacillus bombi]
MKKNYFITSTLIFIGCLFLIYRPTQAVEQFTFDNTNWSNKSTVNHWPALNDSNYAPFIQTIDTSNTSTSSNIDDSIIIAPPNNYWQPERYSQLNNFNVAKRGATWNGSTGAALHIIDNSLPASVTISHFAHVKGQWIDLIYTVQTKGDNAQHNWNKGYSQSNSGIRQDSGATFLNLGTSTDSRNWFNLWTNSCRPQGLNNTEQASRWDITLQLVNSSTKQPTNISGLYQFTNVNTQKVIAFPTQPLVNQKDQIINLDTKTKLKGHFDANGQFFDVCAQNDYTNSSDIQDHTASFMYLFKNGHLQFSVIRSANIVHPSTMFVRAYPSLSVKQSLSNPDIAATTNKNGQLFDENNQLISQISPDKAAFHIFQNFPNQPNSIIPHTYQIKLSLPTNVTLDSNQSVQLSSLNYRLLTATMKNSARLNKLTSDNHDGTHTYQYSLTNTVLNNLNLLLQFNLQINWDDPSIQKQLITIDKDQYFPIKIKTQVQIDSGTKTQQNWDLPEITSRVQVPNETIRFHYQNKHQKEIQKSVYCHGKLGTPVNYQVPTNFVDKYNQEYQYLNAVDDQGQPVNFNQLYYHYNHGKETNIYLTYQEKGLHHSALAGKKIVFLGSSVTRGLAAGGISFVDFLKSEDGVNTIKNAIDGTTLAGRGANTYVNRMKKQISPQTKLDAFVCQLSTNDVAQNKTLGTISNSKDIADFDINTTTGAIEYVIKYVQDTWHCPVIFYTGLYRDNPKYNQLVARLFELQKKWNFSIIDLYNNSDINNALKQNYNIYMADAIHPRKVFYQDYWTPIFRQELLKLFN